MNYNIILNEIKELVLRDEIKSNDEVVSLYDLVEVLNEYIKPINEVLGNKELLDKINEDIKLYSYFNKACNGVEEYNLKGCYKKNDYINSKLGDSYSPNIFKYINVTYNEGLFTIELLLSGMGQNNGIKITKDKEGKLIFTANREIYKDFDIEVVKKYWEDILVLFDKLESRKDIFDVSDVGLEQVVIDNNIEVDLKVDKTLYDLETDKFRVRKYIKLDTNLKDNNDYYMINNMFGDMFSISNDALLKRIMVNLDSLKLVLRDIYLKSINNGKGTKSLKKEDLNN